MTGRKRERCDGNGDCARGLFVNFRIGSFYRVLHGELVNEFVANAIEGNESIYLRMGVKKTANGVTGEEKCDGDRRFRGVTSISNNYEGCIQDISTDLVDRIRRENR